MIVVDCNVLAHLWIQGPLSESASACLRADPDWVSPALWRSEFCSVLALYLRTGRMDVATAKRAMENAQGTLKGREFASVSPDVLDLVSQSSCSAYDCEYVALARRLGAKLVTKDAEVIREFPADAIDLDAFIK